jgi:hypothetical protein
MVLASTAHRERGWLNPGGLYFIEDLANNGLGDGRTGRHCSDRVRNTRRVFRQYLATDTLPEPHALANFKSWRDDIASIDLHVSSKLWVLRKR